MAKNSQNFQSLMDQAGFSDIQNGSISRHLQRNSELIVPKHHHIANVGNVGKCIVFPIPETLKKSLNFVLSSSFTYTQEWRKEHEIKEWLDCLPSILDEAYSEDEKSNWTTTTREGVLDELIKLWEQNDDKVINFIMKWGPMWVCHNHRHVPGHFCSFRNSGVKTECIPYRLCYEASDPFLACYWLPFEPIDSYRKLSKFLSSILIIESSKTCEINDLSFQTAFINIWENDITRESLEMSLQSIRFFAEHMEGLLENETVRKVVNRTCEELSRRELAQFFLQHTRRKMLVKITDILVARIMKRSDIQPVLFFGVPKLFAMEERRPNFSIKHTGNFVSLAFLELSQVICNSKGLYVCCKCNHPYIRTDKRPKKGWDNYCPNCRPKRKKKDT